MSGSSPVAGADGHVVPPGSSLRPPARPLAECKALLDRSRLAGRISAFIFLLAALAVVDGLQTLMRHEFNRVDIIPGEQISVSGMLPYGVEKHTDLDVEITGEAGISFTPIEVYKGFWMGGKMWRADITAAPDARPGKTIVTVVDYPPVKKEAGGKLAGQGKTEAPALGEVSATGEALTVPAAPGASLALEHKAPSTTTPEGAEEHLQNPAANAAGQTNRASGSAASARDDSELSPQNPTLVFAVTIWPSDAARRLADNSFFRAYTGVPAFAAAAGATLLALLAGVGNWLLFGRAEAGLAAHGVYFIHGIKVLSINPKDPKEQTDGIKVAFAHAGHSDFTTNESVILYDRGWKDQGRGTIIEVDEIKAFALFSKRGVHPEYGWLISRVAVV